MRELAKGLLAGALTGATFGLVGFLLLRDSTGAMGGVIFLLLPAAAGFAVAMIVPRARILLASVALALLLSLSVLLITGLEGWVCVILAFPLLLVGVGLGALLGWLFKTRILHRPEESGRVQAMLITLPLLLFVASKTEEPFRRVQRTETFSTSLRVSAPPDKVWRSIKSAENLRAPKPLLLRMGLPVPQRCVLEAEAVGATRICYFDRGYIKERITEWNPPYSLGMVMEETRLPGRHWLSFKDARFEIRVEQGTTIVTRQTTIGSLLSPAWYWRPLERWGVDAEHEYLFRHVKTELSEQK